MKINHANQGLLGPYVKAGNRNIVLYHADCNDGITAAWAFRRAAGVDHDFIPVQHGQNVEFLYDMVLGRHVVMLDFSFKLPVHSNLIKYGAKSISIFDHHVSAQRELVPLQQADKLPITYLYFDMKRSGAGIAWDLFVGEPRPKMIDHVEGGDLWKFDDPNTKPFVEHLRQRPRSFDTLDRVYTMCQDPVFYQDFVDTGKNILAYKNEMVELMTQHAHEVEVAGHKVWAVNVPYIMCSETAHALIRDRSFGMTYYKSKTGKWDLSFRSNGFDVSEIAKKFGGGGHNNAAGAQVEVLPWKST